VAAVLLPGPCARGRASRASCVDLLALVLPDVPATRREALERRWQRAYETDGVYRDLERVGKYAHVDVDVLADALQVPIDPVRLVGALPASLQRLPPGRRHVRQYQREEVHAASATGAPAGARAGEQHRRH